MIPELCGFEFDWFAIDEKGNVGLFSTAGHGFIPREIYPYYKKYFDVTGKFELPNLGSLKIWKDYANYGLYVFDWKLYHGPYIKMENPNRAILNELKSEILRLPFVPILSIDFACLDKIEIDLFS